MSRCSYPCSAKASVEKSKEANPAEVARRVVGGRLIKELLWRQSTISRWVLPSTLPFFLTANIPTLAFCLRLKVIKPHLNNLWYSWNLLLLSFFKPGSQCGSTNCPESRRSSISCQVLSTKVSKCSRYNFAEGGASSTAGIGSRLRLRIFIWLGGVQLGNVFGLLSVQVGIALEVSEGNLLIEIGRHLTIVGDPPLKVLKHPQLYMCQSKVLMVSHVKSSWS